MVFCERCSTPAQKDTRGYFDCKICSSASLVRTKLPYIEVHLASLVAAAGMQLCVTVKKSKFHKDVLSTYKKGSRDPNQKDIIGMELAKFRAMRISKSKVRARGGG